MSVGPAMSLRKPTIVDMTKIVSSHDRGTRRSSRCSTGRSLQSRQIRTSGGGMRGLMQETQLTLDHFFRRGERLFPNKEILTAMPGGAMQRRTYREWADRSRRVGGVLDQLGVSASGRVASFAWNTGDHLDLWFSVPCSGRVLHTLNLRLYPEQLTFIVNHAEDEVIFLNRSVAALLFPLVPTFKTVRHLVVMDDGAGDVPDV